MPSSLSPETEAMRDIYFGFLVHSTRPLWHGPDPEVALEALLEATGMLRDLIQDELVALRLGEVE